MSVDVGQEAMELPGRDAWRWPLLLPGDYGLSADALATLLRRWSARQAGGIGEVA